MGTKEKKEGAMGSPKNEGQFFESHGSKLEPHPGRTPGQAAKMRIAQAMLLLGIGEDPLNGFSCAWNKQRRRQPDEAVQPNRETPPDPR